MVKPPKAKKVISDTYLHQINVLKTLSGDRSSVSRQTASLVHQQISEIAERSGLRDEKEVLRYLYILEGQKLVSPYPIGDFTSRSWCITNDGVRALKTIAQSAIQ